MGLFDLAPSLAAGAAAATAVVGGVVLYRLTRSDPLATVPRSPSLPVLGHLVDVSRMGMHKFLAHMHLKYGPVLVVQLGPVVRTVSVGDVQLIREILNGSADTFRVAMDVVWQYVKPVTYGLILLDGDAWKRSRRLTAPAFQPERVRAMTDLMVGVANAACDLWEPRGRIALNRELYKITADVISLAALGFNLDLVHSPSRLARAVEEMLAEVESRIYQPVQPWRYVPTPADRRFRRNVAYFRAEVQRMLRDRLAAEKQPRDMLAALVAAVRAGEMTEAQLAEEAATFLLAGHETTATALSFCLYELAQRPELQRRAREEVLRELGGRDPAEGDDLSRLRLVGACFDEALRMYPPAHFVSRQLSRPATVGGYTIPQGTTVMLAFYAAMRDPRHWGDDVDEFKPERFLPGGVGEGNRAYMPFSTGPRMCPGRPLAAHEARVILAVVLRRFELRLPPGQAVGEVPAMPSFVLRPARALDVLLTPRKT